MCSDLTPASVMTLSWSQAGSKPQRPNPLALIPKHILILGTDEFLIQLYSEPTNPGRRNLCNFALKRFHDVYLNVENVQKKSCLVPFRNLKRESMLPTPNQETNAAEQG